MRLPTGVLILNQWQRLVERASGLGHRLAEPEQDTEVSLVAECMDCEVVFAVDGQEKPYQFSSGLSHSCEGLPAQVA